MFTSFLKKIISSLLVLYILGTVANANEQYFNKNILQMGNISIDAVKREIRIKTRLAIRHGILEFLLVSDKGKTYESALKIDNNKPSDLHTALLLLNVKPVGIDKFQEASSG